MRLSAKMILLFSAIMAFATVMLSMYTVESSVNGAAEFTEARFSNMSASISLDIGRDIEMKRLTLDTLAGDSSFLSALNQYVRDDSDEQKMGLMARTAALQQLYQSPLVEQYACVAFFNGDGKYFASTMNKDTDVPDTGALTAILDSEPRELLLPPQQDLFTPDPRTRVYGLVEPVSYHGKLLGYLAALDRCSALDHIMTFVDNNNEVMVQAVLERADGSIPFYTSGEMVDFPPELEEDCLITWTDPATDTTYEVWHSRIDSTRLHLYIAQDREITAQKNMGIRESVIRRALLIMVPSLMVIMLLSFGLTKSIRRLTQKVQRTSPSGILLDDFAALQALNRTVTSPTDKETHTLELAYNHMMLQLRDSTRNEIALREGALQAQLSALQTQINPHFIYNTLNIISAKSMESGNLEIIEICGQFASMLRYSTDTRSRTATMREEIDNVRDYLLLAKARYEENLEFVIDVPDQLYDVEVPKLTLQPLVENALNHGFDGKNILRKLSIIGTRTSENLILTIRDNGTGFSDEMLEKLRARIREIDAGKVAIDKSGGHIGLTNTCLRLHYYSSGKMRITIHNDHGAVITLTMPVTQDRPDSAGRR